MFPQLLPLQCDFFIVLDFKVNKDWVVVRLPIFMLCEKLHALT